MTNKYTVKPHDLNSDANAQFFILEKFLNSKSFIMLGVVTAVKLGQDNEMSFVDLKPLISDQGAQGSLLDSGTIYNAPVWRLQRGSSAVIMDPVVGDIGLMAICDKDIRNAVDSRKESMPASERNHSPGDAIYLGGVLNNLPSQYLRFMDDGIDLVSPLVINVDAPVITANASKSFIVNSPSITLNGPVNQGAGSFAGDFNFAGNITATGEVTGKGIKLSTHTHGGVQSGNSDTQGPK